MKNRFNNVSELRANPFQFSFINLKNYIICRLTKENKLDSQINLLSHRLLYSAGGGGGGGTFYPKFLVALSLKYKIGGNGLNYLKTIIP